MTRWDYWTTQISKVWNERQAVLTTAGAMGWELVETGDLWLDGQLVHMATFKRPLP